MAHQGKNERRWPIKGKGREEAMRRLFSPRSLSLSPALFALEKQSRRGDFSTRRPFTLKIISGKCPLRGLSGPENRLQSVRIPPRFAPPSLRSAVWAAEGPRLQKRERTRAEGRTFCVAEICGWRGRGSGFPRRNGCGRGPRDLHGRVAGFPGGLGSLGAAISGKINDRKTLTRPSSVFARRTLCAGADAGD